MSNSTAMSFHHLKKFLGPGGFHALNICPLFKSSRTQKVISLSSCEAELRGIVSSASSNGIYVRSVCSGDEDRPLHLHRFVKCAPACDEERSWKSETFAWKVAMGSEQNKDFNMVQGPTDNMADTNTKPFGRQRIRYLMNPTGCWRSEDQTRVGERERKAYEGRKNFCRKGHQDCQDDCENGI